MSRIEVCPGGSAGDTATTTIEEVANSQHITNCRTCGRPLRAVLSIARCHGPVCWRRRRPETVVVKAA